MKLDTPNPQSFTVEPVKFKNPEDKYKFVSDLVQEIEEVLSNRTELEKTWEVAVKQYNSRLEREDSPQPFDSKIDIPTTRKHAVAAEARLINPVFMYDRVFTSIPRQAKDLEFVRGLEDAIDWMVDKTDFRTFCHLDIKHSQVYSKAVTKTQAFMCKEKRIRYEDVMEPTIDPMTGMPAVDPQTGQPMEEPTGEKRAVVADDEYLEVYPEIIPTEDFIHPRGDRINEMPWVCHRFRKTTKVAKAEIQSGRMYGKKFGGDKDYEKVLVNPGIVDKNNKFSLLVGQSESEDVVNKEHEFLEIYTQYGDREVIITTDREAGAAGRSMRFVYNWMSSYPRPFDTFAWEPIKGSLDGTSLCYIMEPLHRARSASFNQRLDAASRANEVAIFCDLPEMSKKFKKEPFRGGFHGVSGATMDNFREHFVQFNMMQPYTQLQSLEADLSNEAAEVANIPPYLQGKESIDRPTATGQVKLIEEASQPHFERLDRFREHLASIMRKMVARYRQYYPDGLTYYVAALDEGTAAMLEQTLRWPDEFWEDQVIIETRVSSQNMSRSMRKQELLALTDKVVQLTQPLMEMATAATTPQPTAMIAEQLVKLVVAHAKDTLKEFDSPYADMIDVTGAIDAGKMYQQQLQQLQSQMQQMGQQMAKMDAAGRGLAEENAMLKGQPPPGGGAPPGGGGPPTAPLGPPGMGGGGPGPAGEGGGIPGSPPMA